MPAASSALEILLKPAAWTVGEPSMIVLAGDEPLLAWHMLALLRDRLCPDEADRSWAWREFDGTAVTDPRAVGACPRELCRRFGAVSCACSRTSLQMRWFTSCMRRLIFSAPTWHKRN